ncbi:MAG: hypothetical protein LBS34_03320 [Rickettsiales bacterium]|jgi:hypothetical protein|nr:hypothetical protein [Rickettsiales bacterium]
MVEQDVVGKSTWTKAKKLAIVVLAALAGVLLGLFILSSFVSSDANITNTVTSVSQPKENEEEIKKIGNNNFVMEERMGQLEKSVILLQSSLATLENNIAELQNQNPTGNEKNLQIVIFLNKIQNIIRIGGDFSSDLRYLEELSRGWHSVFENIIKLENYTKQKTQSELKSTFFREYKEILKNINAKSSIVKQFLNDNIVIRKTGDVSDKSKDAVILAVESSINNFDYSGAIKTILDSNYASNFPNTLEILNNKVKAINLTESVMDLMFFKK